MCNVCVPHTIGLTPEGLLPNMLITAVGRVTEFLHVGRQSARSGYGSMVERFYSQCLLVAGSFIGRRCVPRVPRESRPTRTRDQGPEETRVGKGRPRRPVTSACAANTSVYPRTHRSLAYTCCIAYVFSFFVLINSFSFRHRHRYSRRRYNTRYRDDFHFVARARLNMADGATPNRIGLPIPAQESPGAGFLATKMLPCNSAELLYADYVL